MDVSMYVQAALDHFARLDHTTVGQVVRETALLGRNGREINN